MSRTPKLMNRSRPARPRSFFWQGVLILFPVLALTLAGFLLLHQDRQRAAREAQAQAVDLAEQLADHAWSLLTSSSAASPENSFAVDLQGQLVSPLPYEDPPAPQPWLLDSLSPEQRARWREIESHGDAAARVQACKAFLESSPPGRFPAAAQYRLALALNQLGRTDESLQHFESLAVTPTNWVSESGLPLPLLARFKMTELLVAQGKPAGTVAPDADMIEALGREALRQPSSITRLILNQAERWLLEGRRDPSRLRDLQREWRNGERLRGFHRRAQATWRTGDTGEFHLPRICWIEFHTEQGKEERWMAIRTGPTGSNPVYFCRQLVQEGFEVVTSSKRSQDRNRGQAMTLFVGQSKPVFSHNLLSGSFDPAARGLEGSISVEQLLGLPRKGWPAYFDVSLDVAGRTVLSSNRLDYFGESGGGRGGGTLRAPVTAVGGPPAILGSAARIEDGVEWLRVNVHLVSPTLLQARQREWTRWFTLLLGGSALAATIGFISARRAFQRQQQLADLKSNFVSSVSHELRAPIASVQLMAESLERGTVVEGAKQRDYFRFIVQECRRLGTLIENVLDFSRIEQGRKRYEIEPTDVVSLVSRTVQLMEPAASQRGVALRLEIDDAALNSLAEPPRLDSLAVQQALINLLDNAIKHSPTRQEVLVNVGCATHHAASDRPIATRVLFLAVEDHGPGIPPEEHERIFERFYRLGSELRRETQGVGIGLSIVKHIAEAHGGLVRVESKPGQGSRFVLELPLVAEPGDTRVDNG